MVTTIQIKSWIKSPVTIWMFQEIEKEMIRNRESLGNGATLDEDSVSKTAIATAKAVGKGMGLRRCQKLIEEKLREVESHEQEREN